MERMKLSLVEKRVCLVEKRVSLRRAVLGAKMSVRE
ncbi:hypothetical protein X735_01245 [Mesorhizobium sp. L2C085B000]|nr:hypothetical protein X735_01245 [Mesorhizobium sp. L2C085B000]